MKSFQRGWLTGAVLTVGLSFGTARIAAAPLPQEHSHDDYSRNPRYQEGMRDGKNDLSHHRDHYKKRHFKRDDDQKRMNSATSRVTMKTATIGTITMTASSTIANR
jgi:hypothetical protein